MMSHSIFAATAVMLGSATTISSFSPQMMHSRMPFHVKGTIKSHSPLTSLRYKVTSDDDIVELVLEARDCAHSDSCPIEEAKTFLARVNEIQEDCVKTMTTAEVCEDPIFISEVIEDLRAKIGLPSAVSSEQLITSGGAAVAAVPATPSSDFVLVMTALLVATSAWMLPMMISNTDPFTAQEWMWAIQGGYLDDMIGHYFRNGGL